MTIMREERAQDAHDLDNVTYNLAVVVALLAVGSVLLFRVKLGTPRGVGARPRPSVTLRGWGVPLRRVKSALRELERKTFHLCGLLVPLIHLALLEAQLHTVVLDLATSDPEWDVRSAANEALAALQKSEDGAEAIRLYRERYGEDGSRVPAVERQEALAHLQKTVQYWQRKVQAKSKGRIAMMLRQARAQGKGTVKSAW